MMSRLEQIAVLRLLQTFFLKELHPPETDILLFQSLLAIFSLVFGWRRSRCPHRLALNL